MKKIIILLTILNYACSSYQNNNSQIDEIGYVSGIPWFDTNGDTIEAHAGGMLQINDTYYWYGEHHGKGTGNKTGVCCYSSQDLIHWKNEGIVLPKDSLPVAYRDSGVCERPKVIYNAKTKQYVMWMHLDDKRYFHSYAGVAVCDSAIGKFRFIKAFRPIKYDYGFKIKNGCSPLLSAADKERMALIDEMGQGNTLRDMNLFLDDDGKAYVLYSSEDNTTLYISNLSDDFMDVQRPSIEGKTWVRAIVGGCREAPAPFKYNGKYYMFTSGLTGWAPNPADIAVADNMLGPWKMLGNPCKGPGAETTFHSQSTFVFHAPGKADNCFVFMGDRWNGKNLEKSTFVWIPFCIQENDKVEMVFLPKWNLSIFDKNTLISDKPEVSLNEGILEWKEVKGAAYYKVTQNTTDIAYVSNCSYQLPIELAGKKSNYNVTACNLYGATSPLSDTFKLVWDNKDTIYLSDIEPEMWSQGFGSPGIDKSVSQSELNIAGRTFKKGIGTHSPSSIRYQIGGNYSKLAALVGVDYFPSFSTSPSIRFKILGDDKILFESPLMHVNDKAISIEVPIKGVHTLELIVEDGGDGTHYDHADWANLMLIP